VRAILAPKTGAKMLTEVLMKNYFHGKFREHFPRLEFSRPNKIVLQDIMNDNRVIFFGGPDWENVRSDLEKIPVEDRERFILSLFMVVITDQAIYTHFREKYQSWREKTAFPKFGWSGFGPHNENPLKLLWAPERDGVIDTDKCKNLIPEFVSFWISESKEFFKNIEGLDYKQFFLEAQNDQGWQFSQGLILNELQAELKSQLEKEC